jgi:hypothetical protein
LQMIREVNTLTTTEVKTKILYRITKRKCTYFMKDYTIRKSR